MFYDCKLFFIFFLLLLNFSCRQPLSVEKINELKNYSSGSAMAFYNNQIYLMGDDMNYLLITDTSLNSLDSLQLESGLGRIPKSTKQDIEAAATLRLRKSSYLLLLGSGSIYPYRNKGWLIDLRTKQKTFINLDTFYKRILASGIEQLNIEGVASIPGSMVLANRGNKSVPKNYLIFTSPEFWNKQGSAEIRVMKLGSNEDTASFNGVSGIEYSYKSDCLILTVSTENTYSTQTDGVIGKSYLWLINNISSKKRLAAVNPNRIIDLQVLDDRFRGHKIESVCIVSENKLEYDLVLVADNDEGTSILFRIKVDKKE